jgi:hypothetical protein
VKEFELRKLLSHPCDAAFTAYRDRLVDLPAHLPNIDQITVLSREEPDADTVIQVARWQANQEGNVPRLARPFIKKDLLVWIDHATWHLGERSCEWHFEFPSFPRGLTCGGKNRFEPAPGGGCTMILRGSLHIDLAEIRGVPRIARGLGPKVEAFVLGRVTPNLESVTEALGKLLSAG